MRRLLILAALAVVLCAGCPGPFTSWTRDNGWSGTHTGTRTTTPQTAPPATIEPWIGHR